MAIKLKGIINSRLGNICLRGEARIKDLIKVSEPDKSYQREADSQHLQKLKMCIQKEVENRYFPELTFALKVEDFEQFNIKLKDSKSSKLNISENISIFIKKVKSVKATRASEEFEFFTLNIEDNHTPLFRIDGNHRLEAAREEIGSMVVSFTIIVFNNENYEKTAPIIFNNINYKQLPISKEQNIKRIIKGKYKNHYIYNNEDLIREFENYYPMIRKLGKIDFNKDWIDEKVQKEPYETVHDILEETYKNTQLCSKLNDKKIKNAIDRIISCFDFCTEDNLLNKGILVAGVRTFLESNCSAQRLEIYKNWVLKQNLLNIYVKGKEIYKIFTEYLKALEHTIFVSMPFNNESTVENPYNSLKNVIDKINSEYDISLKLLRIDKKPKVNANNIPKDVIDGIKECGLLIANLSDDEQQNINGNVYHEIGYAMGIEQGEDKTKRIKLIKHKKTKLVGFNIKPYRYLEYDDNMEGFEKNMKQELLDFYDLK